MFSSATPSHCFALKDCVFDVVDCLLLNVVWKSKKKKISFIKGLNFSRNKKNAKRMIEKWGNKREKTEKNLQLMPLISWLLSTNVAYQALK